MCATECWRRAAWPLGEVLFLLYDELREPRAHLAILEAIGSGQHTFKAIKEASLIGDVHLPMYLRTLQDMSYVERRLPVTISPAKQAGSRQGRYHTMRITVLRQQLKELATRAPDDDLGKLDARFERCLR